MKRLLFLVIIIVSCISSISGQDYDLTYTAGESGTVTHTARNSVTLGAGYTYTPGGGSLTIEIQNPVITGPVSYTTTPIDPETRTLNTSYPVGATKGVVNIDPAGGATYTVPLELLPGVNGLAPSLSLVYSSNNGPGIAGYGWQLEGLSKITRGPQTYHHDGASRGVELDFNDRFYLDGQRLVNTTSYNYESWYSLYQTDNDIFTRISPQSVDSYGPAWFKAQTKSGLVYEYGNTSVSKQQIEGYSQVVSWYVSKISDLFGNNINFTYIRENNSVYPVEITYGPNTITFSYKERDGKTSNYLKGAKIQQWYLLDKIAVKYNSTAVKTYEFKYTNQGYYFKHSTLNEIIEYGTGTGRYNSTAFTYQIPAIAAFSQTTFNTTHGYITYSSKLVPGDFNGDGKADFLCLPDASKGASWTGMRVYFGDGNDNFTTYFTETTIINLTYLKDIRSMDINGDGMDDILYETYSSRTSVFYYMLFDGSSFTAPVVISSRAINIGPSVGMSGKTRRSSTYYQEDDNERTFIEKAEHITKISDLNKPLRNERSMGSSDYNGDGVNDIFINTLSGGWTIYSFVNASGQLTGTLNTLATGTISTMVSQVISGDFNGDGKSDLWSFESTGLKIYTFTGTTLSQIYTTTIASNSHFFTLGDFNSDGKVDMFLYGNIVSGTEVDWFNWQIQLSTGVGFECNYVLQKRSNLKDETIRVSDFNGDGASDIMVTSGNPTSIGATFYITRNYGTDFDVHTVSGDPIPASNIFLADYNGDSRTDFICTDGTSPYWSSYKVFKTTGNTTVLMEKAGNGLGMLTKFTYSKLSQAPSTVYQRGTGASYPLTDFQGPMNIVASVQIDNGKGSLNTVNYYYEGAKIHLRGKGILGYIKSRSSDATTSMDNETVVQNGFNSTYFYPSVQLMLSKRTGTTDTISKVKGTMSHLVLDATKKWIFPYVSSSKETNKLTGHYVTINTSGYDNYGNPSSVVKTYSNGPTETATATYDNTISTSQWLLGRPTSSTVQYTGGGNTITRTVTRSFSSATNNLNSETWYSGTSNQFVKGYKYNTNGTLKRDSVTAEEVYRTNIFTYETNGVRVKTVTDPLSHTTTNTYDSYGKPQTVKDYLNNTLTYQYDDMGRITNVSSTDGNQAATAYAWESPSSALKSARYSVLKTGNDGSQSKSWLDKLGREIRSDVKGFDGSWIYTDTRYNTKGQVDSISEPYYTGQLWNRYQYDNYGRKTSLTRPSGRNSSWVYSSNTVTETTGGKSFSKTYSSDGTVSSASDAGGTISYTYYPDGKVKTITAPGSIVTQMQYDVAGNQTQLIDPSAGIITYTYDGFGQLFTQQNARSQTTTINYNPNGTVYRKLTPEGTTKYRYNTNKQLTNISSPGNVSRSFAYDTKGRVTTITDTIPGTTPLITTLTYDTYGRPGTITHPSNIVETKNYNSNGYLSSVSTGGSTRWTTSSMNSRQQVTSGIYGSSLNTTSDYGSYGFLNFTTTGSLQNYYYSFDMVTGNLSWRKNVIQANIHENFEYDNLDRLDRVYRGSTTLLDMAYDSNKGGITTKSDAGTLNYNVSGKPYALGTVNPSAGLMPTTVDSLTYTSFESVNTISEGNFSAYFTYNSDNERAKMEVKQSGNTILTRWYPNGNYIKESAGGVTKEYTFIGGGAYSAPVVAITQSGTTTYYNLLRDHLGSITHVVNASNNTLLYEYSYDSWGRMRNVSTWTNYTPGSEPSLFIAGRGFTGHEHLPWFNLINMNGRVYDPLVGQFLSPDNHVQAPYFTQSLNRYVYCLNNPLKYADPSGEKWKWWHWLIAELLTGGISSTAGITYASIVPSIPAIQGISAIADYASVWIKSWSDPGGAGNRFDNAIKIDLGQIMIFPWEVEQTLIGNAASHFRNLSGKVDNVEISNGSILVNDYDRYDPTDSWGFTLGPYINSKNVEVREDIYYHELGHTIQSRFLGPLYISRIAVPSGFTGFYSYYVWNDYGEYHEKCLYEVWANKLGGPKESSEYPRSFRKNSFWYWWWFIILPSYPN